MSKATPNKAASPQFFHCVAYGAVLSLAQCAANRKLAGRMGSLKKSTEAARDGARNVVKCVGCVAWREVEADPARWTVGLEAMVRGERPLAGSFTPSPNPSPAGRGVTIEAMPGTLTPPNEAPAPASREEQEMRRRGFRFCIQTPEGPVYATGAGAAHETAGAHGLGPEAVRRIGGSSASRAGGPLMDQTEGFLRQAGRPMTVQEIRAALPAASAHQIRAALTRLQNNGRVERVGPAHDRANPWRAADNPPQCGEWGTPILRFMLTRPNPEAPVHRNDIAAAVGAGPSTASGALYQLQTREIVESAVRPGRAGGRGERGWWRLAPAIVAKAPRWAKTMEAAA